MVTSDIGEILEQKSWERREKEGDSMPLIEGTRDIMASAVERTSDLYKVPCRCCKGL